MQHNLRDTSRDHDHGRIYRVTYPGPAAAEAGEDRGRADRPPARSAEGAGESRALSREDRAERPRHEGRAGALQAWMGRLDPKDPNYEHHMMEALWVQQWHNRVDETLLKRMLRSKEPWARAAATRVLCYWRDRVQNPLGAAEDAGQRRASRPCGSRPCARPASSSRRTRRRSRWPSRDHPQDRFLEYTFDQTMKTLTSLGKPATDCRGAGGCASGRSASGFVGCRDAAQPARSGRAGGRDRNRPRADAVRCEMVRRRSRQAGAGAS